MTFEEVLLHRIDLVYRNKKDERNLLYFYLMMKTEENETNIY
jgi:hypothetical protein